MSILDKHVLKLNRNWQAFEVLTVRDAITMLCSETNGEKPGYAMDFLEVKDENGHSSLAYSTPTSWDDWIKLPIREQDFAIQTSRGPIRAPLVVICANYAELPLKKPRFSKGAVAARDNYTCQYSGEKLKKGEWNIDHVVSKHRGGRDTWENTVCSRKDINFNKGHLSNKEAGLKLIRIPKAPVPSVVMIKPENLPEETRAQQSLFLFK